jgi:hypothetical protein
MTFAASLAMLPGAQRCIAPLRTGQVVAALAVAVLPVVAAETAAEQLSAKAIAIILFTLLTADYVKRWARSGCCYSAGAPSPRSNRAS